MRFPFNCVSACCFRGVERPCPRPTLLAIPAIYVAPRDDEETPKTQNKEMKTWFKIGRN